MVFGEGAFHVEQRGFASTVLKGFGVGTKSIESRIQENLVEFLDKVYQLEGEPIQHTRIFSSHVVSSLWSVIMTEKLEQTKLDHLAYIVQEK